MNTFMITIEQRINAIALKLCSDYPNIETVDSLEQLWAIESSLIGTNRANSDLHKVLQILKDRLNMSDEELIKIYDEVTNKGTPK